MLKEQAIAQEVQYKKLILDYTEHEEALKNLQHTIINSSLQDDEYIRLERQFERRKHYYHKLNSYKIKKYYLDYKSLLDFLNKGDDIKEQVKKYINLNSCSNCQKFNKYGNLCNQCVIEQLCKKLND